MAGILADNDVQGQFKKLPYSITETDELRRSLLDTGFDDQNIVFLNDRRTEEVGRFLPLRDHMQDRFGLRFPLVEGNAERLPFRDRAFDLAVSEYGASLWCDPYLWVPEASRVLRPYTQGVVQASGVDPSALAVVKEGLYEATHSSIGTSSGVFGGLMK